MGKVSRAGRKQRSSHRPAIEAEESTPTGDLAAALTSSADATPERAERPHLEDDFFARGEEISSFPPSSLDPSEPPELDRPRRVTAGVLERRARMRRIVAWVVGASAMLTAIGGARALMSRSSSTHVEETSLSVPNRVVPSIALAAPTESNAGTEPAASESAAAQLPSTPAEGKPPVANAARAQRLPIVDVEIPAPPDPATDRVWESAAQSLAAQDFGAADRAFAELGRRSDAPTRETARLARAVWWIANGKQSEVRTVLADLAANATTPAVQQQARQLLLAN